MPFSAGKQSRKFDLPKISQKLVEDLFKYFRADLSNIRTATQLYEKSYSETRSEVAA